MPKPMAGYPLAYPPDLPQPLAHDRDRVARGWHCEEPWRSVGGGRLVLWQG